MSPVVAVADPWVRWDWVRDHTGVVTSDLGQHLRLTAVALLVGLAIALPLGVLAHRWRRAGTPILAVAGVVYTVPSLALFALLVPRLGLSTTTAEVGLVGYTLLILIRNIVTGLDGVPDDVLEAARGMGFTRGRMLWRIELPLAVPAIVAGVRIATVTTIGLVTVTALIGQGGLGQLMLDGLTRDFRTPLVVGAVLSVALASLADVALLGAQGLVTPWSRSGRSA